MARMATEVAMVLRGESRAHRFLRARLTFLAAATLLLDALATGAMYMLEHDARGTGFHTLGGALFWVSAQLTTVSSQLPNPVTPAGRVIDIVLEVWAITVAATLAASLAAFFRARHTEGAIERPREAGIQRVVRQVDDAVEVHRGGRRPGGVQRAE